jgi:hypothetical protein
MDLCLVACAARKAPERCKAADLYRSAWFRKARAWVEHRDHRWMILSAQHGLVHPDALLDPYDKALTTMPSALRRAWSFGVISDLERLHPDIDRIIILAGRVYRDHIVEWAGARALVPMAGMGIGEQLAWLTHLPKEGNFANI